MKFMVVTLVLLLASLPVHAEPPAPALTASQASALEVAARAGADNQPQSWPMSAPGFTPVLQAIVLHESSACMHLLSKDPRDKNSLGCGQVTVRTAAAMAGVPVSRWMLVNDWNLNIELAGRYLADCFARTHQWQRAVVCYNRGPGRARAMTPAAVAADPYMRSIKRALRELRVSRD